MNSTLLGSRAAARGLAALALLLLLGSCAGTGGAIVTIEEPTTQETAIAADGPADARRAVRVRRTAVGVEAELGPVRVIALGAESYAGSIGLARGEIRAGGVRLLYDAHQIVINGPFTAGVYPAREAATLTVDPSGAVRRGA
jgi:hypothetical protein